MDDAEFAGLVQSLHEAAARVETLARSVPAARWDEIIHSGDGPWTRRQLLAHVAANDLRQLVRVRIGAGIAKSTDAAAHAAELVTHVWNQQRVDERKDRGVEELLAEMRRNRQALIDLLIRLTPAQRSQLMPFRGEPTPL